MAERTELLEAALDGYPEGLALLDMEGQLVIWNRHKRENRNLWRGNGRAMAPWFAWNTNWATKSRR